MAGASDDTLVESFDEAERARLLARGKIPGELMFSHELIRQTVLSDVSAAKRQRLHLRTAQAISRLYSDDLESHAGDLAHHLSHAGRSGDRARLAIEHSTQPPLTTPLASMSMRFRSSHPPTSSAVPSC